MILPVGNQGYFECQYNNHSYDLNGECILCGDECPHDDIDGMTCLICGKDLTEDFMCKAEDMREMWLDRQVDLAIDAIKEDD